MNLLQTVASAVITAVLASGCAAEKEPRGVIPEGYNSAVKKAQGVEATLEDAMQSRGQELDQSGR